MRLVGMLFKIRIVIECSYKTYERANRVLTRFAGINHLTAVHLNARRM